MFNYKLNFIPSRFFVFGCGGTGSRLVPLIAQYARSCDWLRPFEPEMYLIDFDVVETKNLARQNFVARDIGINKAEVLARRYSNAYEIPITAIPYRVRLPDSPEEAATFDDFNKVILKNSNNIAQGFVDSIVFICVDSIQARQEIVKMILSQTHNVSNCIIIDTGNENDFGQVKLSGLMIETLRSANPDYLDKYRNLPDLMPQQFTMECLPFDLRYFHDMKPPEIKASCAELEQTMAINSLIANTAFSVFQNLLSMLPISVHRYNVSLMHGTTAEYFTVNKLIEHVSNNISTCRSLGYLGRVEHVYNERIPSKILAKAYKEIKSKFPTMLKNYTKEEPVTES